MKCMNEKQNNATNQNQPQQSTVVQNTLAGSPGVIVAPIENTPTDASNSDKGQVLTTSSVLKPTPTVEQTPQSTQVKIEQQPMPPTAPPPSPPVQPEPPRESPKKKSPKTRLFIFLLLLITVGMGVYIYLDYRQDLEHGECSPLVASDNTLRELDINSDIVQELYSKVKTTIREDLAYHTFDDTLKIYLAYRQIPHSDIYDSNCNLFNENTMSNFACSSSSNFTPKAFKEETLQREIKKLFGENTKIENRDIVLGNSCFGGYQYIEERGEYVQGYCGQVPTTSYNVEKELISATVQGDTITIKEKVRYYSAEGINNDELQNGIYVHTFKLDNHYHYAYINRTLEGAS